MSFEEIEELRREYTDKYVEADSGRPELQRFSGRVGRVVTVNMNGRALVEFAGSNDIGWYDIALDFLKVVPKPEAKKPVAKAAPGDGEKKPAKPAAKSPLEQLKAKAKGEKKPAGKSPLEQLRAKATGGEEKPAGKSPLEQLRAKAKGEARPEGKSPLEQVRAKAQIASKPAGKSPIEQLRAAAAANKDGDTANKTGPDAASPASEALADEKPLSKLEQARAAARKRSDEVPADDARAATGQRPSKLEKARAAAAKKDEPPASGDGDAAEKPLSKLEQARASAKKSQ